MKSGVIGNFENIPDLRLNNVMNAPGNVKKILINFRGKGESCNNGFKHARSQKS